jgi:uncharacterized Tic20 family protein
MENSPEIYSQSLTSEEKTFALFSHLSVVIGGIILPISFWAIQKDKSKFVRFHALQSIFYHIAVAAIIIILVMLLVIGILIGALAAGFSASHNNDPSGPLAFGFFMILFYIGLFVILIANAGYGIYLAVKAYEGNLIKIPIIGKIIYKKVYGNQ